MKHKVTMVCFLLLLMSSCNNEDFWPESAVPKIESLLADRVYCSYRQKVNLTVEASGPEGYALSYRWLCTEGKFLTGEEKQMIWQAPEKEGPVTILVIAAAGSSAQTVQKEIVLHVRPEVQANYVDEAITISPEGNVGIHMDNPAYPLEVNGTIKGESVLAGSGDFTGNLVAGQLSAAVGNFSGNLVAGSGNFTGNLNSGSSRVAGDLTAAEGNFSGNLVAGRGNFGGNVNTSGSYLMDGKSLFTDYLEFSVPITYTTDTWFVLDESRFTTGTWIFQVYFRSAELGGAIYSAYVSGVLSMFYHTNDTATQEIPISIGSHAICGRTIRMQYRHKMGQVHPSIDMLISETVTSPVTFTVKAVKVF